MREQRRTSPSALNSDEAPAAQKEMGLEGRSLARGLQSQTPETGGKPPPPAGGEAIAWTKRPQRAVCLILALLQWPQRRGSLPGSPQSAPGCQVRPPWCCWKPQVVVSALGAPRHGDTCRPRQDRGLLHTDALSVSSWQVFAVSDDKEKKHKISVSDSSLSTWHRMNILFPLENTFLTCHKN